MDLRQRPPRSPRCRLGGFIHLPRLLDKARAHAAGTAGEYNFNCPLDRTFFEFTGLTPDAFLAQVRTGLGDGAMLAWIEATAPLKRSGWEIQAWSTWLENRGPGGAEAHAWFSESIRRLAAARTDVRTLFDLLDLDDHVAFGGQP